VSFGLLFREFLTNFFSTDSRFGRTIFPFLFRPGLITQAFNAGQRVRFANPFRLYVTMSVIHFFFFTWINQVDVDESEAIIQINLGTENDEWVSADSDSLAQATDSIGREGLSFLPREQMDMIDKMNREGKLSSREIMDSLNLNDKPWFTRQLIDKMIRIDRDQGASVNSYLLRQIPVIMFFILPLYALILKLFFWRRGLYIHHMVHSLHIHSFAFFVLSLAWITALLLMPWAGTDITSVMMVIAIIIIAFYLIISFRRVYQLRWYSVVLRLVGVGLSYTL
jgi:hypothetical protein